MKFTAIFALMVVVAAIAARAGTREALLLDDVRHFFGCEAKLDDQGAAEDYLRTRFPEGTREDAIRSTICELMHRFDRRPGMDVQHQLSARGEALHFVRVFDPKAPALYRITVMFSFDESHHLEKRYPMIVSEVESWHGPLDDVTREEPNQTPEPTTTLVTPRADARVAPSAVVAHL